MVGGVGGDLVNLQVRSGAQVGCWVFSPILSLSCFTFALSFSFSSLNISFSLPPE